MFVSVLNDLQQSLINNLAAMDLPVAILAFETTATVDLEIVLDSSLAQLAVLDTSKNREASMSIHTLNGPWHFRHSIFYFMFNSC